MFEMRGQRTSQTLCRFGVGPAKCACGRFSQAEREQGFGLLHGGNNLIDDRNGNSLGDALGQSVLYPKWEFRGKVTRKTECSRLFGAVMRTLGRRLNLVVLVLADHAGGSFGSSFTPRATIRSDPSGSGRCSFTSSGGAVIQVSTSSGVVRITGIALGWMAPTTAFGSVVRNA